MILLDLLNIRLGYNLLVVLLLFQFIIFHFKVL